MGLMDYFNLNKQLYKFSHDQVKAYQEKEVLKLVNFAKKGSAFYGQKYSDYNLASINDLYKLPIINKQILMENFDDINTCGLKLSEVKDYALEKEQNKDYQGYYMGEYVVGLSSGTSGNKGIFITPKAMTKRLPFVFLARSGIPLKLLPFRILFLLRVFSQGFADINSPFIKLKYLSTMTPVEKIIEEINCRKINVLMGPPSLIRLIIPYIAKIKVKIRMIICYAEVLDKEDKERFALEFNTKVIEIYQASEGQIGSACKHGNLHINEDLVLVELYDSKGEPVTKSGIVASKMLVTNLVNTAQPLIRYEMNDLIVLGEPCTCGSKFRVIKKVLGRHDDVLYFQTQNGEEQHIFPDLFSRWIITTSDKIREFKVIQNSKTHLEIIVDIFDSSEAENIILRDKIRERIIRELLEFEIKVVVTVEIEEIHLPQDKAKYKRFCNFSMI
jgi:putative adenylate-forming enzyme